MRKNLEIGIIGLMVFSGCNRIGISEVVNPTVSRGSQDVVGEMDEQEKSLLETLPEEYQRLAIPYLREQSFPGTEIQIERMVSENNAYTSYLAWYESEGLKIYGLLTKPKSAMPEGGYPGVVFIHGYIPPLEYRTEERYVAYVDSLAEAGLVVFKIDLRGHGNSEGEPNGAYYSSDYIYDALNARESLKRLSYVDSEKIGLWGHSMAGNVVLRSMAVRPEIPAGVIWSGAVYTYTDMREYQIQDSSYEPGQNPNRGKRDELYKAVGEVSGDNEFWSMVAPSNFVGDLQGKVEIHHAINDPVVSIRYSRNLKQIMSQAGTRYELFEYSLGGHDIE